MLRVQHNVSLLPLNTFGMDVPAAHYSILQSEADVTTLDQYPERASGLLVLGGGSNMLFTQPVRQWVLHNQIIGIQQTGEDEDFIWLEAGGGTNWHEFVMYCVSRGLYGVENLSLIPGTIGAAPIQNIGAYGAEVKDVITSVRYFDLETRCFSTLEGHDCDFGYRDSIFKRELSSRTVITSVQFRLGKKGVLNTSYGTISQELDKMGISSLTLQAVSEAVIRIRQSKLPDPRQIGNAGSFFKNPEVPAEQFRKLQAVYPAMPGFSVSGTITKIPAAWLIEQCGWKGYRERQYGVHQYQPLVLVNYGGAQGSDIFRLSEKMIGSVNQKFGIVLEREVRVI
jgi:UDP-N-acetylmuramate dehydrogenase